MNREELSAKIKQEISHIVYEKGFVAPIDLFVALGYLKESDVSDWRMKRVPFLERKITCNLGKVNHILRDLAQQAKSFALKPSMTVYNSWGKGSKQPLRFSKSGDANLERTYATHFVNRSSQKEPQ
jgi:hypothetical protein